MFLCENQANLYSTGFCVKYLRLNFIISDFFLRFSEHINRVTVKTRFAPARGQRDRCVADVSPSEVKGCRSDLKKTV